MPKQRTPRFSPTIGAFAGVVLAALLLFAGAGVLWGVLRPGYTATVVENATRVQLGYETNVEFAAYGWFVLASVIISTIVATVAYVRAPRARGIAMLLWVGLWCFIGAQVFIYLGELAANFVHGVGDTSSLSDNDTVLYVPAFSPGIVAHAVAPFWAVLLYWCCIVIGTGPHDPEPEETDMGELAEPESAGESEIDKIMRSEGAGSAEGGSTALGARE